MIFREKRLRIAEIVKIADDMDERSLAQAAQEGSSDAYDRLISLHHARVFAFLLSLTRHRQDAEDLTQDTFVRAWRNIRKFDLSLPMLPWLLTIARRQSIANLRKRRPLPEPDWMLYESEEPTPSGRLWRLADRCLSRESFSALWLHYRDELPLKEVAKILGKREGAVKVLLHRARSTLAAAARPTMPPPIKPPPLPVTGGTMISYPTAS